MIIILLNIKQLLFDYTVILNHDSVKKFLEFYIKHHFTFLNEMTNDQFKKFVTYLDNINEFSKSSLDDFERFISLIVGYDESNIDNKFVYYNHYDNDQQVEFNEFNNKMKMLIDLFIMNTDDGFLALSSIVNHDFIINAIQIYNIYDDNNELIEDIKLVKSIIEKDSKIDSQLGEMHLFRTLYSFISDDGFKFKFSEAYEKLCSTKKK